MRRFLFLIALAAALAAPGRASAQVDLSGLWGERMHEDEPHRQPGPELGDYTGLPINAAARLRADTWMASVQTLPERQCIPHPSTYAMRGPANMRIWTEVDVATQAITAVRTHIGYMAPQRWIYLDGRPHPPESAAHTWQGFSTGRWEGNTLVVTTTHIKAGYLQRNGVPHSDRATMTEYFTRHGSFLTHISIVDDPVYLTEPLVRSSNWQADPTLRFRGFPCDPAIEVAGRTRGEIPHYLPGANPYLQDFARRFGLSAEAARGGAHTMYPEFARPAGPVPEQTAKEQ